MLSGTIRLDLVSLCFPRLEWDQPHGNYFLTSTNGIRYVYHSLITDKKLSDKVEKETTVSALAATQVDKQVRNDRLFLRAYEGKGPYTKFVLFKVPVLPAKG